MNPNSFVAPLSDVNRFLFDLKHILTADNYELDILLRKKNENPLDPFTTENTLQDLAYDISDVRNDLLSLTEKDYIETILDDKDTNKPPFWVFGKFIKTNDVYIKIKIRNKLTNKVFCVSFHYARHPLKNMPYV
jgi:hypothetical protein